MANLPHSTFEGRHPSYNARRWAEHRAIAFGGPPLLDDPKMLRRLLPPLMHESDDLYANRCARAHHCAIAGGILESLVGSLLASPLAVDATGDDPVFWNAWAADVSREGGRRCSLQELARDQVLHALTAGGVAYTMIDFPSRAGLDVVTLAQEEALGLRRPHLLAIPPEGVIDWQEAADGELAWVLVQSVEARRDSLTADRKRETWSYRLLTRTGWQVWRIEIDKQQRPQGPFAQDPVTLVEQGAHTFGRVPLVRLELPQAMHVMARLFSTAVAHFNMICGATRAMQRSLAPIPVEFLAPEDVSGATVPNPEVDQNRGRWPRQIGEVLTRAAGDDLKWIGADPAPVEVALKLADDMAASMFATVGQIASAIGQRSAAAMSRSGLSKQIDRADAKIVLSALGQLLRDHVREVYELAAVGRGDVTTFAVHGAEHFDDAPGEAIEQAQALALVEIPSPTFKVEHSVNLAARVLGDKASPAMLDKIRAELTAGYATDPGDPHAETGARAGAAAAIAAAAATEETGEPEQPAPTPTPTVKAHELSAKARRNARREGRNGA